MLGAASIGLSPLLKEPYLDGYAPVQALMNKEGVTRGRPAEKVISHMERIFLLSGICLVTWREYSCCLASDWSHGENIPVVWHLIGHMERIFLLFGI